MFPFARADKMVALALAIDNLTDHLQLLVDEGKVDEKFLDEGAFVHCSFFVMFVAYSLILMQR